jgi:hypothetical protein
MKTRSDYDQAIGVAREVIHRWDPYSLLAGGCPQDEFDSEIQSIVALIPHMMSQSDAIHSLSRVFSSAFEPEYFGPKDCADAGTELYDALMAAGLVAG